MFTSLVITRLIFDFLVGRNIIKTMPMLQFVKETHIDFSQVRQAGVRREWLLIVIGIGFGIKRGTM
jgi:hypothetical protein